MDDLFVSVIRTWVPIGVGAVLTWVAATFGIIISDDTSAPLMAAVVAVVIAVYYALARVAEKRWPLIGQILLALGLVKAKPTYRHEP